MATIATALITGSTGFIGSHIARALASDYQIVGLNRRVDPALGTSVVWDFSSELPAEMPPRVDLLIHTAASTGNDPDDDGRACFEVNVHATARLLAYARGTVARSFVHFSTGSTIGFSSAPLRETDPFRPVGAYACTKAAAECLLAAYQPYVPILCIRPFHPYGPGQRRHMLVPRLIDRVAAGDPIPLNGPAGHPRVSPLYIDDLVLWLRALVDRGATGTYHLAGAEAVTVRQLADLIAAIVGRPARFEIGPPVEGDAVGDITRVQEVTGLAPRYSLAMGLQEVIHFGHSINK